MGGFVSSKRNVLIVQTFVNYNYHNCSIGTLFLSFLGLNWLATNGSLQPLPPSLCRLLPMVSLINI